MASILHKHVGGEGGARGVWTGVGWVVSGGGGGGGGKLLTSPSLVSLTSPSPSIIQQLLIVVLGDVSLHCRE
jgi:hypothetical protein